jgi:hypothetical protein
MAQWLCGPCGEGRSQSRQEGHDSKKTVKRCETYFLVWLLKLELEAFEAFEFVLAL